MSQTAEETFARILPLCTSPHIFLLLMSNSKTLLSAALLACLTAHTFAGTVLIGDNFNAPDTNNFDNSDQTGRRSGLLASDIQLRSSLFQHGIAGNQLNFGVGRVRFQSAAALPQMFGGISRPERAGLKFSLTMVCSFNLIGRLLTIPRTTGCRSMLGSWIKLRASRASASTSPKPILGYCSATTAAHNTSTTARQPTDRILTLRASPRDMLQ